MVDDLDGWLIDCRQAVKAGLPQVTVDNRMKLTIRGKTISKINENNYPAATRFLRTIKGQAGPGLNDFIKAMDLLVRGIEDLNNQASPKDTALQCLTEAYNLESGDQEITQAVCYGADGQGGLHSPGTDQRPEHPDHAQGHLRRDERN